jgi:ribonuclease Z
MEGSVVFGGPGYRVEAVEADHDGDCWSYALVEAPRPGRFHPDKARALGVPEGVLWKKLQRGGDVILEDSTIVRSSEVVDPPRRGRKIVYSGDTRPSKALVKLAEGADILLHEATFDDSLEERAIDDGHSTASQAAEVAESANVGRLLLTHISSRYPDPGVLLEQARNIFKNTAVAEDLMKIDILL